MASVLKRSILRCYEVDDRESWSFCWQLSQTRAIQMSWNWDNTRNCSGDLVNVGSLQWYPLPNELRECWRPSTKSLLSQNVYFDGLCNKQRCSKEPNYCGLTSSPLFRVKLTLPIKREKGHYHLAWARLLKRQALNKAISNKKRHSGTVCRMSLYSVSG